jgi:hypothetical protein
MRQGSVLIGCLMGVLFASAVSAGPRMGASREFLSFGRVNTSYGDFRRDEIACATTSRSDSWVHRERWINLPRACVQFDKSVFLRCMSTKGYGQDANGYRSSMAWRVNDSNRSCDASQDMAFRRMIHQSQPSTSP